MHRPAPWVRWATWLCLGLGILPLVGTLLAFWGPPGLVSVPLSWPSVWWTLLRSLCLALCVCGVAFLFGAPFAWVQARWHYPGQILLARLTVLPLVLPSFLLAITIREALAPKGHLGEPLGLSGRFEGFWASVFVLGLACAPYVQLTLSSAISALARDQEEAARSLGAGPWRLLSEVQWPALRPAIAFGALLVLLYAVADFGAVAVLNTRVLTWELFQAAKYGGPNPAALGLVMVAAVLPLVALGRWVQGQRGSEALGRAGLRTVGRLRPKPIHLVGVYALQAVYLGAALVLPLVVIAQWGLEGAFGTPMAAWVGLSYRLLSFLPLAVVMLLMPIPVSFALMPVAVLVAVTFVFVLMAVAFVVVPMALAFLIMPMGAAALTTAGLGLGAGCIALLLGGIPARWTAQRGGGGSWTEFIAYGVSGLPGVLTAYGFLQLVQVLPHGIAQVLEGLFLLLILGLGLRFLAHPYGLMKSAFLREDPRPLEAAQTLGASNARIFFEIRMPTLAPAAAAGFLLAFIAAIKELPITLMLLPAGHHSLATIIYDGHEDAHFAELGVSALLLLAMVLVAQSLLRRWSDHD